MIPGRRLEIPAGRMGILQSVRPNLGATVWEFRHQAVFGETLAWLNRLKAELPAEPYWPRFTAACTRIGRPNSLMKPMASLPSYSAPIVKLARFF